MSLINEVLRDLDARHAAASEKAGLAPQVRALPAQPRSPLKSLVVPVLAALLGGMAVWGIMHLTGTTSHRPAAVPPISETPLAERAAPADQASTVPKAEEVVPPLETLKLADSMKAPEVPVTRATAVEKPASATTPSAVSPKQKAQVDGYAATETAKQVPASPAIAEPTTPAQTKQLLAEKKHGGTSASSSSQQVEGQISKQPAAGGTLNDQAEAEYRRGIAALRRGASNEAGEAFRAALKIFPAHAQARQALLGQLVELRQWQSVEVVALDGLGMQPGRSEWALLAARVQYERGDFAQALDTLNQYAAGAKSNADYQVFYALLLQRAQRNTEAVLAYQAALAIRPAEGRWWYGLGRALDADHREAEARQAYERARDSGNLSPDLQLQVERRLK